MTTPNDNKAGFVGKMTLSKTGDPNRILLPQVHRHQFLEDRGGYLSGTGSGSTLYLGYAKAAEPETESTYEYPGDFGGGRMTWTFVQSGNEEIVAKSGSITIKYDRYLNCSGTFHFFDDRQVKYDGAFDMTWSS